MAGVFKGFLGSRVDKVQHIVSRFFLKYGNSDFIAIIIEQTAKSNDESITTLNFIHQV
jgi:hypothetical protein